MKNKILVLFDFDGTITTSDTFPLFLRFCHGNTVIFKSIFILHILAFHYLKIYSAEKSKKNILKYFFSKYTRKELNEKGSQFIEWLYATGKIKSEFIEKIQFYKTQNADIAVVSASPDIWIHAFCEKYNLIPICTELQFKNEVFEGEFKTPNCNKLEKKIRIEAQFKLDSYSEIIAFGNSAGDNEMMSLAHQKVKVK